MKNLLLSLCFLTVINSAVCAGAEAIDPRIPALSQQLAASSHSTLNFMRFNLSRLRLRHLQILNAANEFNRYALQMAQDVQNPGVDPITLRMDMRNMRMWGTTVDYHLAEAGNSSTIEQVRARWATTVQVYNTLALLVPPQARAELQSRQFEQLYAAP